MATTFPARYPGRCARTGASIRPGDTITSIGRGRYALVSSAPPVDDYPVDPDLSLARSTDPELADSDPDAARAAGRYLRQSLHRGVSHVWTSGGREYYRNRRGLCEDAPCCGCCTA
jgi:hypothetical protein